MRQTILAGILCWLLTLAAVFVVDLSRSDDVPASTVTPTALPPQTQSAPATAASSVLSRADDALTLRVLTDGEVTSMTLHDYVCAVVAGEMPASFPREALRAQAIAARTMALYRLTGEKCHDNADVCDDPAHCSACIPLDERQYAFFSEIVASTDGLCALWEDEPICAAFHAVSGGHTESSVDVWGGELAYLRGVDSPGEEAAPRYRERFTFSRERFAQILLSACPTADLSDDARFWFKNSTRTDAGTILRVYVGGQPFTGAQLRSLFGLTSADFTVSTDENAVTITCTGHGHGVGMSQYGAYAMAQDGHTAEEIICWYYTGVTVDAYIPA